MFKGKPQYYEHMSIQTWTLHMLWRNCLGAVCKVVKRCKLPSPQTIILSALLLPNQSRTTDKTTQFPTAIDDYLIFQSKRMTLPHTYRHSMKSLENLCQKSGIVFNLLKLYDIRLVCNTIDQVVHNSVVLWAPLIPNPFHWL